MSELLLPQHGPAESQTHKQVSLRRKGKRYTMLGILPEQYKNQFSNPGPPRVTLSRSFPAVIEPSIRHNDARTPLGSTPTSKQPVESTDEDADYKIRYTTSESKSTTLLRLTDLLFSESYLHALANDVELFPRFTAFLKQYKPELSPMLLQYIEYQKILKAVDYANAVASTMSRAGSTPRSAVELSSFFSTSFQPTLEALLVNGLPAWVTYSLVKVVTFSLTADIANETTPLTRDIVRGLGETFCITDPNQKDNPIVYASEEFYKFTGYGRDGVIGKNCRFLQGPKTKPESVERIRSALKKGEEICETLLNYRRDATPFINVLMMAPLHDDKGVLRYYLGAQVDASRLVESGRGVEGFKDLLAKQKKSVDDRPGMDHNLDLKGNIQAKQRELSLSFDSEETSVPQRHSEIDSRTIDGRGGNKSIEPTLPSTKITQDRNIRLASDGSRDRTASHASSGNMPPQKLPGIYNTYLLIRPYPSLRTIFVSQKASKLGQIQQRPFLAHVAAPQSTLTELKDAFKSGTPITAQIALKKETGIVREGTITGNWGEEDSPTSHGRSYWISATPLLNSDDRIGVWMIVIVDKSNAGTNAEGVQEPSPPEAVSIMSGSTTIFLNVKERAIKNEKIKNESKLIGIKAEISHNKTLIEEPEHRPAVSQDSDVIQEPDIQVDPDKDYDGVAKEKTHNYNGAFLVPEGPASSKREDENITNDAETSLSSPQAPKTDSLSKAVHDLLLARPSLVKENSRPFDSNEITESTTESSPHTPTLPDPTAILPLYSKISPAKLSVGSDICSVATSDESIGVESSISPPAPQIPAGPPNPSPNGIHDLAAEPSFRSDMDLTSDANEPVNDQKKSFCSSLSPQDSETTSDSRPELLRTESWLNSATDSMNGTGSSTHDILEAYPSSPTQTFLPIPGQLPQTRFSPPPSPALSSTSSESLDLDPDLLRERKLNGRITSLTPRKHREHNASNLIPMPNFLAVRDSLRPENDLRGAREHNSGEAERPLTPELGESGLMEIPEQNIYVVKSDSENFAAAGPDLLLSSHENTAESTLEIIFPVKEKNSPTSEKRHFLEQRERVVEQKSEPKLQSEKQIRPSADHAPSLSTQTFTLDPHEGVLKIAPLNPIPITTADHDTGIAEHENQSPFEPENTVFRSLDFLAMRSRIIRKGRIALEDIVEDEESECGKGHTSSDSNNNKDGDRDREGKWQAEETDGRTSRGGAKGNDDEEQDEPDEWADAQPYHDD